MARYSRRSSRGRRSYSGRAARSYSGSRTRGSGRRSSRRSSGGGRTIRIVLEQPAPTSAQLLASRGLQPAAAPRRRSF